MEVDVACLEEVGGKPGDVELPAKIEAHVLAAKQPDGFRSEEGAPWDAILFETDFGWTRCEGSLGVVDGRVILGMIAKPTVEDDGPEQPKGSKEAKGEAPIEDTQKQNDKQGGEGSAPAGAQPHDPLRADSFGAG